MLFNFKSLVFLSLLIASHSVYADFGASAVVSVKNVPSSLSLLGLISERTTLSAPYAMPGNALSNGLLFADSLAAAVNSPEFAMEYAYAEAGLSGAQNPPTDSAANADSSTLVTVPLPTTAWCFLIGLMTVLGMSKRRHSHHH